MFIYQAAAWCDACGEALRARLDAEGKCPADPGDESAFDSGDYPKGPYVEWDESADCPQHCDAGPDCLSAETLPNGDKVGALLETGLTPYGERGARDSIADALERRADPAGSVALALWAPAFRVPLECEHCGAALPPDVVRYGWDTADHGGPTCAQCVAPTWERFDICEALACIAHDFGLYALGARLDSPRLAFRPRPNLATDNLEPNGAALYLHFAARVSRAPGAPTDPRPWAGRE